MTRLQKDKAVLTVAVFVLSQVCCAAVMSLYGLDGLICFVLGALFITAIRPAGKQLRKRIAEGEK